ncbi:MAG: bifunctional heptose 7-phosphate kinase/heptose 1-phosphate adenyltransferase [Promethearchaeota archaeon]
MILTKNLDKWKDKRILIIGEALIDRYIFGNADRISPDAPVPNVKISENQIHLGAIGLVAQYILSFGGKPEICTVIGNDYEGEFFMKKISELKISTSNILIDGKITTPQITRVKATNQQLLRLETDYSNEISLEIINEILSTIEARSESFDAIIILDYGVGLFTDALIQKIITLLKESQIPIIARPSATNYYLYENVDLIKINLQKALNLFSIDCCTDTSVGIVGKRILSSSKSKSLFLNYLETDSYLLLKNEEKLEKIHSLLKEPVRSFVAVGSAIMAVLGLCYASGIPVSTGVQLALHAAVLSAISPPVDFFNVAKLKDFISSQI